MTSLARDWLATFADPEVLADVEAAAEACMRDGCAGHDDGQGGVTTDPERCDCRANLMTPLEFLGWVRDTQRAANGRPHQLRTEQTENRRAGQLGRWSLAAAG